MHSEGYSRQRGKGGQFPYWSTPLDLERKKVETVRRVLLF